jgi:hypothetical protein
MTATKDALQILCLATSEALGLPHLDALPTTSYHRQISKNILALSVL